MPVNIQEISNAINRQFMARMKSRFDEIGRSRRRNRVASSATARLPKDALKRYMTKFNDICIGDVDLHLRRSLPRERIIQSLHSERMSVFFTADEQAYWSEDINDLSNIIDNMIQPARADRDHAVASSATDMAVDSEVLLWSAEKFIRLTKGWGLRPDELKTIGQKVDGYHTQYRSLAGGAAGADGLKACARTVSEIIHMTTAWTTASSRDRSTKQGRIEGARDFAESAEKEYWRVVEMVVSGPGGPVLPALDSDIRYRGLNRQIPVRDSERIRKTLIRICANYLVSCSGSSGIVRRHVDRHHLLEVVGSERFFNFFMQDLAVLLTVDAGVTLVEGLKEKVEISEASAGSEPGCDVLLCDELMTDSEFLQEAKIVARDVLAYQSKAEMLRAYRDDGAAGSEAARTLKRELSDHPYDIYLKTAPVISNVRGRDLGDLLRNIEGRYGDTQRLVEQCSPEFFRRLPSWRATQDGSHHSYRSPELAAHCMYYSALIAGRIRGGTDGRGVSVRVRYRPTVDGQHGQHTNDWTPYPDFIALAHELSHGWALTRGEAIALTVLADDPVGSSKQSPLEELVNIGLRDHRPTAENIFRDHFGLPRRESHYETAGP